MLTFFIFLCFSTAPFTEKPPKILFPSESEMNVIEVALGKATFFFFKLQ